MRLVRLELVDMLRAIPDSEIGVGTNCVICNCTYIIKIRHTSCHIYSKCFRLKLNCFDCQKDNKCVLCVLLFCSVYALAISIATDKVITGLKVFTLHLHLKYNSGHIGCQIILLWFG